MINDIPKKRSLTLKGHRTSISLEEAFWQALRTIAAKEDKSISQLVEEVDAMRGEAGLSSAIRLYILAHYQNCIDQQDQQAEDLTVTES